MCVDDIGPPVEVSCEVVYSAEMAGSKPPTHGERIDILENALGLHRKPTWRESLAKNWKQLIGPTIALAALIITNFAWYQPRQVQLRQHEEKDLAQQVDNQIDAKFKEHHFDEVASDVKIMKGQMQEISGYLKILVEKNMRQAAELSPREFQNSLPEIKSVLSVAGVQRATVPNDVVKSLREGFQRADDGAPEYWSGLANFITYESSLRAGFSITLNIPRCPAPRTSDSGVVTGINPDGTKAPPTKLERITIQDCLLDLDQYPLVVAFGCNHCVVKYSGGALTLKNVVFEECLFLFSFNSEPTSADGRLFARNVLKNDATSIAIL